ncbi:MAG: archaeal proteasome endopeptidase complex subunit beta [Candidatus Hadarchaeum sp.]|nr:archaeal proteasome endopeptidase complex subunit beta [Candidatus Hadarchaeum sp.]
MEKEQKYLEGTTTVALACRDGVVLATDTRATAGYLVASKIARKVYQITESIGMTVAGGVADTQNLVNILRAEARYFSLREGAPIGTRAAAQLTANILHAYSFNPYLANLLIAGFGEDGSRIFFLDLDGSMTEEKMASTGSGSPVAYGVLENEFKEGVSVKDALPVAVRAIKTAMKRDIATGNEVMLAVITEKGYKEFSQAEIKKIAA